jgi:hypothetical protein
LHANTFLTDVTAQETVRQRCARIAGEYERICYTRQQPIMVILFPRGGVFRKSVPQTVC